MPQRRALAAFAVALPLTLTAAVAAEAPPAQGADKAPIVCRGGQKSVGSRIRTTRRCRRSDEWREDDEKSSRLPIGAQVTQGQNDGRPPVQPH
jgi:hypothetical protein